MKHTDYDFSEIQDDLKDIIKIIENECDCDCEQMNNLKLCGRCQAIFRLNKEINE